MPKCADPSTPVDDNKLSEIIKKRNRLVRSVMHQPTELLRDIATLAVGWVMHELEVMERQHQAPSDQLSLVYSLRIIGLADGQYGNGFMVRTSENGPQMFDSSTSALVAQLHEHAGIGVEKQGILPSGPANRHTGTHDYAITLTTPPGGRGRKEGYEETKT
jgi:hypothetical protein